MDQPTDVSFQFDQIGYYSQFYGNIFLGKPFLKI